MKKKTLIKLITSTTLSATLAANALMISNLTDKHQENINIEIISTEVDDINNISDKEKNEIKQKVKKANQRFNLTNKEIDVANDGTVTIKHPDYLQTVIPADKTVVQKRKLTFKNPAPVVVANAADLTAEEVKAIQTAINKANPTIELDDIKVDKAEGVVTVNAANGKQFTIPVEKVVASLPTVTPVANATDLTAEEVKAIQTAINKANPTIELDDIKVDKAEGVVTVNAANGKQFTIPVEKATYVLPELTPVANLTDIQDSEEAKIIESIKNANASLNHPDVQIAVNKSIGEVTVTPSTGKKFTIPAEKVVASLPTVTPVANAADLTAEEVKAIQTAINKANPTIELDDIKVDKAKGVVTVNAANGKQFTIPVEKATYVLPELIPVANLTDIQDSEEAKIIESIKNANASLNHPDVQIAVNKSTGEVTVTPSAGKKFTIPAEKVVASLPTVTPVANAADLTAEEVKAIQTAINKANPTIELDDIKVDKAKGVVTVNAANGKQFTIPVDKATYVLPELTPVANSTDIQDSEEAKIKESIKNANASLNLSDDQIIVNKSTGEVTVTPSAGKEFVITTDKATYVLPELTPVSNSTDIQDSEVAKIKESIKNANASLNLSDDQIIVNKSTGEVTVTPSAGKKFVITTDKATYVLPELTPVANSTDIQDSEEAKMKESIKNANASLNLSDDQIIVNKSTGEVTVTPSAGKKFTIPAEKVVASLPTVTPVANAADLTAEEVKAIQTAINKANPTIELDDIKVDKAKGVVTVNAANGKQFTIPVEKATYVLPELTPVANSTDIQDSEVAKIKESIKNANASLNLSDDQIIVNKSTGEVTVTPSAGKKFVITTDKATYVLPELTPVANSTDIQDSEEAKMKESIKNANASLNLSDDQIIVNKSTGEVTVTPSAGKKFTIPAEKVVASLPTVTPVANAADLTAEEVKAIQTAINKANPTIELDDIKVDKAEGVVTVNAANGKQFTIPVDKATYVLPELTPVANSTDIQDSEESKIIESIKNANASLNHPDVQIAVNKSTGEVTVTPSAGKKFVITTDKATYVLPELTPVANSTDIQDSEEAKIKESIKNANASLNLSDDQIIVNKSTGEVTVTPSAGKKFVITTDKATYVLPELTPVANSTDIQDSEEAKMKESIKNANASLNLSDDQIIVNKSIGEVTVTPSTGKKFTIPAEKVVASLPTVTPVANAADLTAEEVKAIQTAINKANPTIELDDIKVDKAEGVVTVNAANGKQFTIPVDKATYVLPELTPVANSTDIQDSEEAKIKESIKNANASLNLSDDQIIVNKSTGEVTVTPSAGKKFVITTDKATYVLPELTPVANSTDIQDSEVAKIKESIKNANASLNLSDDQIIVNKSTGEVTVTPSAGKEFVITTDKATYVLPELTPVSNSTDIQDSEVAKIKESIKNANASLNLSDDQIIVNKSTGEVTVTPSAGKKFVITTDKATYVLPELTPVANSTDIQDSEEAKIKESIKNANASLNLSDDQIIVNKSTGEVTVTPSAGKKFTIPADKVIKKQIAISSTTLSDLKNLEVVPTLLNNNTLASKAITSDFELSVNDESVLLKNINIINRDDITKTIVASVDMVKDGVTFTKQVTIPGFKTLQEIESIIEQKTQEYLTKRQAIKNKENDPTLEYPEIEPEIEDTINIKDDLIKIIERNFDDEAQKEAKKQALNDPQNDIDSTLEGKLKTLDQVGWYRIEEGGEKIPLTTIYDLPDKPTKSGTFLARIKETKKSEELNIVEYFFGSTLGERYMKPNTPKLKKLTLHKNYKGFFVNIDEINKSPWYMSLKPNSQGMIVFNNIVLKNISATGDIVLGDEILGIGYGAFNEKEGNENNINNKITSISGNNVTAIGGKAFQNAQKLTTINFPNASIIRNDAFNGASSLEFVNIKNVKFIAGDAFKNTGALKSTVVPEKIANDSLLWLPKVTSIGNSAFENSRVKKILANNLEEIGTQSFLESDVTKFTAPKLFTMGNHAFKDAKNLENISIPSVTKIGKQPFVGIIGKNTPIKHMKINKLFESDKEFTKKNLPAIKIWEHNILSTRVEFVEPEFIKPEKENVQ
ncbi:leucine-rich repeat protein [Mycoplasma phocoenae]|uniref:Leucine-rich repeat protein n=1 Tax=Mycoplasma phocoenae TaxID=754517 RepID=A0A858U521_9MOLU|nr:leucine-rich repeat protein [Mycoplasma phocoenae]QJG67169.1 leucine-rich repeat protein [Mycoplasma phocoenae]